VVVRVDEVAWPVEALEHLVEGAGFFAGDQPEGRDGQDRHGQHHPDRAEAEARGLEEVGGGLRARLEDLTCRCHDAHAPDPCRQPGEPDACAVRPGPEGARDGLPVDVPEVLEGQAPPGEGQVERDQPHASAHGDERPTVPEREDPLDLLVVVPVGSPDRPSVEPGEVDHRPRRGRGTCEGVAAAHDPEPLAVLGGAGEGLAELVGRAWLDDGPRLALRSAAPRRPDSGTPARRDPHAEHYGARADHGQASRWCTMMV